jgi:hypothetical protein
MRLWSFLLLIVAGRLGAQSIVYPSGGTDLERFAALELQRYIYLRTGKLLEVSARSRIPTAGDIIAVGRR